MKSRRFRNLYLKGEPFIVGVTWIVIIEALYFLLGVAGYNQDPRPWWIASFGLGVAALTMSHFNVFTLALRLVGITFLNVCRVISTADYQSIRATIVQSCLDRVVKDLG